MMNDFVNKLIMTVLLGSLCVGIMSGCATLFGGGDPKVTVHPGDRKAEWHGYLNDAARALDMELKADSEVYFVTATHYPAGYAAIVMPLADGQLVGGWTTYNGKRTKTMMAMYPDGRLGTRTGRHEAGRAIMFSNGIGDTPEQDRRLKEAGIW